MRHIVSLSIILACFWWLNSGFAIPLILALGVASIAFVVYVSHRMDVVDHEHEPLHLSPKFPGYLIWLAKEIVLSNIAVVKHVWLGNESITPTMEKIKMSQRTNLGKVIYANSITLTPGTVTVDVDGDKALVHGLLRGSVEGLKAGEMDRRVSALEN